MQRKIKHENIISLYLIDIIHELSENETVLKGLALQQNMDWYQPLCILNIRIIRC